MASATTSACPSTISKRCGRSARMSKASCQLAKTREAAMRGRLVWGVALIAMGAFFLAQQLGLFGVVQFPFWAFAFGLLGLIFLGTFIADRRQWWALIPGFILLGVALMIVNTQNEFMTDT